MKRIVKITRENNSIEYLCETNRYFGFIPAPWHRMTMRVGKYKLCCRAAFTQLEDAKLFIGASNPIVNKEVVLVASNPEVINNHIGNINIDEDDIRKMVDSFMIEHYDIQIPVTYDKVIQNMKCIYADGIRDAIKRIQQINL